MQAETSCTPYKSGKNRIKNFIGHSTSIAEVKAFLGHALYKAPKICFHNVGLMGVKRRRILHRFQKYKLTLVTKRSIKSNYRIKILFYTE
jgi:hypothetical protein